ncbi:MAG: T9SS type A sorting domain-containing protein, partial [Ignavibacteriae bacterium]|nr:T9SS type A sorting domain-containing protein [Ignavibacteriota bacterium]
VRAVVTPNAGTKLTAGPWNINTTLTYNLDYTVPSGIELANCKVEMFVFKQGSPYTTGAHIQNGLSKPTTQFIPTGINKFETTAKEYSLSQNYPNPFNPSTSIRFSVPKDGNVSFKVYDISGKEVSNYYNGYLKTGIYTMHFDGSSLPSGAYFYKLTTKDFSDVKKMILVK